MIEFMPWYQPGQTMIRCGGDGGCGALLAEGDAQLHVRWHQKMLPHVSIPGQPSPHVYGK